MKAGKDILVFNPLEDTASLRLLTVYSENIPKELNGESGFHIYHVRMMTERILKHLRQTAGYSLSDQEIEYMAIASTVHDVGKSRIPKSILDFPGKLSPAEYDIVKKHSNLGAEILENCTFHSVPEEIRAYAVDIARYHHERYDGTGYPEGLQGNQIPLCAQVVALADVYDALTSDRCYKKAVSQDVAIQMISSGMCGAFDKKLVECLIRYIDEHNGKFSEKRIPVHDRQPKKGRLAMKINSIQFRFLITIIAAILAVSLVIGGLSISKVDHFIQEQAEDFIKVSCEKEVAQVNDIFGDMEKSVNIMSGYILDFFESAADIESADTQKEIIRYADRMFADVANYTDGAVAYYLRIAPEISDGKTGFFYSKVSGSEKYFSLEPTNLSYYGKDDIEHVGWYWQPYEAGKPVWMQPYYNMNNDIMMISYVVPLYCQNRFIGVVGMDFDFTVFCDQVDAIKIYDNGFAHLELDGVPIHHDLHIPDSYKPEDYLQVSAKLLNGMTLVFSASHADISQIQHDITVYILHIVVVLASVFCLITSWMVSKIVKPLKLLTDASKKLADGDYNVEPVHSDTYEIHLLSTAFENMAMHLREHQRHQYLLAHMDSMTGLRNTTSYNVWVNDFNKEIQSKNVEFGVIVLDLNNLKKTNDKYGHDAGNKLIATVARLISGVFKRSPIFRIGGDEFLVFLQNRDLENYEALCKKLDLACTNEYINANGKQIPISVASGFAKYDPATDETFIDVFNRADDAMYKNKKLNKSKQGSQPNLHKKDAVHS